MNKIERQRKFKKPRKPWIHSVIWKVDQHFVMIQTSNYLTHPKIMHTGYFIDISSCMLLHYGK